MNVARWSVTRPVAVTMRIAALVLLGAICLLRLPIDLLPRVDIPIVSVNTSWPNTPPEVMEAQVTRPVEQAVASVPGLYSTSSTSSLGNSSVRVTLDYGVDVNQAAVDVLQAVQRAQSSFPNDPTLQRPSVFKFDPSSLPILVYGVHGREGPRPAPHRPEERGLARPRVGGRRRRREHQRRHGAGDHRRRRSRQAPGVRHPPLDGQRPHRGGEQHPSRRHRAAGARRSTPSGPRATSRAWPSSPRSR